MVAERRKLGALLSLAALALLAVWLFCGNVAPAGSGRSSLQLLHTLLVDRDLDFYAETHPLSGRQSPVQPPATPVGAFLLAPAFSVAHIAAALTDHWPPDGLNPNYGLAAGLMTLAAILMGLAVLARVMVRAGAGAGTAAAVTAAYFLASPLAWTALREPGSDDAFAFLLIAMLVALWRTGSPQAWLALAVGATLVALRPPAAPWLLIALLVYRRAPAGDFDDRLLGTGLIAIVLIPIAFLARRGLIGGPPAWVPPAPGVWAYPVVLVGLAGLCWMAIADRTWWLAACAIALSAVCARSADALLAQASPVLLLGCAEACRRLARRGLVALAAVGFATLIAGNLALCAARAAEAHAPDPLHAVAWIAGSPLERAACALAPGDGAMPPAIVLREYAASQGWVILAAAVWLLIALRLAFGRPAIVAFFIAVGFTNAGGMLLLEVADSGVRRACVYSGGAAFVDTGHLVHRWRAGGRVATAVDVVTTLEPLMGLSVADELAILTVRDVHGREIQFGIFAGMDTAEETGAADLSPARRAPERRPPPALGMLKTRLASYSVSGLRTARPFVAQSYRKTCYLPFPLEVDEVRIQRRHGGARLDVHGLWLFTEGRR